MVFLSQGVLHRRWEVDDGRKRGGNEGRRPNKEVEKSAASTCVLRPCYTLCSYFRMLEGKESVQKRTDMNGDEIHGKMAMYFFILLPFYKV